MLDAIHVTFSLFALTATIGLYILCWQLCGLYAAMEVGGDLLNGLLSLLEQLHGQLDVIESNGFYQFLRYRVIGLW